MCVFFSLSPAIIVVYKIWRTHSHLFICTRTQKVLRDTHIYIIHIVSMHAAKKVPWLLIAVEMCMRVFFCFLSIIRFVAFCFYFCYWESQPNILSGFVSLVDISYKFYTEYCLGSLLVIYLSFVSSFANVFFVLFSGKSPGKKFLDVLFFPLCVYLFVCVLV